MHLIAVLVSLVAVSDGAILGDRGPRRPRRQLNVDFFQYDGDDGLNRGGSQFPQQQQQAFQFHPQQLPFQSQPFREQPPPASNNELIFSNNGPKTASRQSFGDIAAPRTTTTTTTPSPQVVFINNQPTLATMAPFRAMSPPSAQFRRCFDNCPTTSEYNPVCGSNMERYYNEQKFHCARRCGLDVDIVRRGSCEGLFPMLRG